MSNADKIQKAVKWILKQAKESGIVVMKYESMSTNSVYLKFDDGVLGTLRVSDHSGKRHLKYKYNLVIGSERKQVSSGQTVQVFAPFQDIELLWNRIASDRRDLFCRYSAASYEKFMEKNRNLSKDKKGFWQKAEYVQKKWRAEQ